MLACENGEIRGEKPTCTRVCACVYACVCVCVCVCVRARFVANLDLFLDFPTSFPTTLFNNSKFVKWGRNCNWSASVSLCKEETGLSQTLQQHEHVN